jgi:hypothetical protein
MICSRVSIFCTTRSGIGFELLQRPAVARFWSHQAHGTLKRQGCATEIWVATVRRTKQACTSPKRMLVCTAHKDVHMGLCWTGLQIQAQIGDLRMQGNQAELAQPSCQGQRRRNAGNGRGCCSAGWAMPRNRGRSGSAHARVPARVGGRWFRCRDVWQKWYCSMRDEKPASGTSSTSLIGGEASLVLCPSQQAGCRSCCR